MFNNDNHVSIRLGGAKRRTSREMYTIMKLSLVITTNEEMWVWFDYMAKYSGPKKYLWSLKSKLKLHLKYQNVIAKQIIKHCHILNSITSFCNMFCLKVIVFPVLQINVSLFDILFSITMTFIYYYECISNNISRVTVYVIENWD